MTYPPNVYCTLDDARLELNAQSTVQDAQLFGYIRQVSRRIDSLMQVSRAPFFAPYIEQRAFPITSDTVSSWQNTLFLNMPILSLSEVLIKTTDVTAHAALYPPYPLPANKVQLTSYVYSWFDYCALDCTPEPPFAYITGAWGYHPDYAHAWLDTDQLAAQVTPSDTTITVSDVDGTTLLGTSPRFSVGSFLKISSEFLEVISVNTSTNVLGVRRAMNGSSLPSGNYAGGTAVYVYQVVEPVRRITARQSAFLVSRQGAYQAAQMDGIGTMQYPQDLLVELQGVLTEFMYV